MPPERAQIAQEDPTHRVLSAIKAIRIGQILSVREAARQFSVPATTTRRRLAGIAARPATRVNHYQLTYTKEETLIQ